MLNLRRSCRGGKAAGQRVPSQQLGLCATQRWRLLYLSGGSQGDLFSSGRENRKVIEYMLHTKEAEVFQALQMRTAVCISEGLHLKDVFFSKIVYFLVMVFFLVS